MRLFFLVLLLSSLSTKLNAREAWTYCDAKNKAFRQEEQWVCNPPRPGEARPDFIDEACAGKLQTVRVPEPQLDYICSYPTAAQSGDDATRNTNRCINADKKHCQIGQGGEAGPGSHHIPQYGWYHLTGISSAYPDVRCQCGCFIGETMIAGPAGYSRIDFLADQAKSMPVGLFQFSLTKGQSVTRPLRGPDFTVGPEEKPVIRIGMSSGTDLTVTDLHPILVQHDGTMKMVQARDLEIGDILMDEDWNSNAVSSLESYKLDSAAAMVFNVDTGSNDPEEHVISANKVLVGDIYWQKRLSEQSSRVNNLFAAAQQP